MLTFRRKVDECTPLVAPYNLEKQWDLLDRRIVYKTLQDHNIPVPPHIVVGLCRFTPGRPRVDPRLTKG